MAIQQTLRRLRSCGISMEIRLNKRAVVSSPTELDLFASTFPEDWIRHMSRELDGGGNGVKQWMSLGCRGESMYESNRSDHVYNDIKSTILGVACGETSDPKAIENLDLLQAKIPSQSTANTGFDDDEGSYEGRSYG